MRLLAVIALIACGGSPSEPPPAPASPASPPPAPAPPAPEPPVPAPPEATPPAPSPEPPSWNAEVRTLTPAERTEMTGVSWHEGCPVPLDDLRVIEMPHHTPDGGIAQGQLIVHTDTTTELVQAFHALWDLGFAITRMEPVRNYGGDDDRSMAADNTSAFNCRPVYGGRSWSQHAFGRAVDVNPLRNPYVRGDKVDPPQGRDWLDRDGTRPGVLVSGSPEVRAFAEVGWRWGGNWRSAKDYQHFSRSGT